MAIGGLSSLYLAILPGVFQALDPFIRSGQDSHFHCTHCAAGRMHGNAFSDRHGAAGGNTARDTIPWAWAINGFASVVGAVLATLLAIHLGFAAVILLAVIIYGIAAASLKKFR